MYALQHHRLVQTYVLAIHHLSDPDDVWEAGANFVTKGNENENLIIWRRNAVNCACADEL